VRGACLLLLLCCDSAPPMTQTRAALRAVGVEASEPADERTERRDTDDEPTAREVVEDTASDVDARDLPGAGEVETDVLAALDLGSHRVGAELIRGRPRGEWMETLKTEMLPPTFPLYWPVEGGRFGRGLSWRRRRIKHRGVDITAKIGTPVHAVAEGVVGYSDDTINGYGHLVILLHGGGEVSAYAHLSERLVAPGERVARGQRIALAGNTGISRGPHLHFEWREAGDVADPMPRFPQERMPRWMQRQLGLVE